MGDDVAPSSDLFDMYKEDIFAGYDFETQYATDLLGPYGYDDTVQASIVDLCETDDDITAVDSNTVIGHTVPPDNPGIFPHDSNAFNTGDFPQLEADDEPFFELTSAEFQRLVAANAAAGATTKTPWARGQKRRRDAADDDDDDAGGARGASLAQQLDPAVKDDGSRQDQHAPAGREPDAATSMVSCRGKRDAATQVSEALLLQEFGSVTPTRDVSTQVSEDDLRNDDDSFEPTTAPEPLPDAANGVCEDELQPLPLPFNGSADFTEYATIPLQLEDYTVTMDQDFVGFFDFDYEQCY
jgi:hypothetical protein